MDKLEKLLLIGMIVGTSLAITGVAKAERIGIRNTPLGYAGCGVAVAVASIDLIYQLKRKKKSKKVTIMDLIENKYHGERNEEPLVKMVDLIANNY